VGKVLDLLRGWVALELCEDPPLVRRDGGQILLIVEDDDGLALV
jgi:hypothetical protein